LLLASSPSVSNCSESHSPTKWVPTSHTTIMPVPNLPKWILLFACVGQTGATSVRPAPDLRVHVKRRSEHFFLLISTTSISLSYVASPVADGTPAQLAAITALRLTTPYSTRLRANRLITPAISVPNGKCGPLGKLSATKSFDWTACKRQPRESPVTFRSQLTRHGFVS
jgi:hypothetical protein